MKRRYTTCLILALVVGSLHVLGFFARDEDTSCSAFLERTNHQYSSNGDEDFSDLIKKINETFSPGSGHVLPIPQDVACSVGETIYKDVSNETLRAFAEKVAQEYKEAFNFTVCRKGRSLSSPLASLLNFGKDPWTEKQREHAKIIFNVFKKYEKLVPDKFTYADRGMLYRLCLFSPKTRPEIIPFLEEYKNHFIDEILNNNRKNDNFLKYAYLLSEIISEKTDKDLIDKDFWEALYTENMANIKKANDALDFHQVAGDEDPYDALGKMLNSDDAWRLCADFESQQAGEYWGDYENSEKGIIASVLKGFKYICDKKGEPVTLEFFKGVQSSVAPDIDYVSTTDRLRFGLSGTLSSFMGLYYNTPRHSNPNCTTSPNWHVTHDSFKDRSGYTFFLHTVRLLMYVHTAQKETMEQIVKKCNNIIQQDDIDIREKVLAALTACHDLNILHPFQNGNTRTCSRLLLCKYLLDIGLYPPMLNNVYEIKNKDPMECLKIVMKGIENFRNIQAGNLGNMKTTQALSKEKGVPIPSQVQSTTRKVPLISLISPLALLRAPAWKQYKGTLPGFFKKGLPSTISRIFSLGDIGSSAVVSARSLQQPLVKGAASSMLRIAGLGALGGEVAYAVYKLYKAMRGDQESDKGSLDHQEESQSPLSNISLVLLLIVSMLVLLWAMYARFGKNRS